MTNYSHYGRNAEAHARSINSAARRERTDPARVAARAAQHREDAEASLGLAESHRERGNEVRAQHFTELAQREFQFAYDEENS
jgi:hypothetical protein